MDMQQVPVSWLWDEIARRFGPAQAAELMLEYQARSIDDEQDCCQQLAEIELPLLEARLSAMEEAGEPETAYMRSLRWRISHHRQVLIDRQVA